MAPNVTCNQCYYITTANVIITGPNLHEHYFVVYHLYITLLVIIPMQHWINNHKKRHVGADTNTADTSDHSLRKRRKVRKPSSYNAFSKEFHRQGLPIRLPVCCEIIQIIVPDTLRGKSLAEKSILMAQAWRELDSTEREKYTHGDDQSTDCTVEQLSSVERKKLIMG